MRVGDAQPEPGALADFLGREERIEDFPLHLFARCPDRRRSPRGPPTSRRRRARCERQRAAAVGAHHRLLGVDDQIQQDLLDLMPVGEDLGQVRGRAAA